MVRVRIDKLNETKNNNFGSLMIITRFNGQRDIDVYFPKYNWTFYNTHYSIFKKGNIKCPYEPRVFGIGYIGEGKYSYLTLKNEEKKHSKCYNTWKDMLKRCYDKKYQSKKPTYIGCTVCEEWHNFQNFAKWYEENYYEVDSETMHLDKDILIKNNKIYSSQTCTFVPQRINSLFKKSYKQNNLPIGVSWINRDSVYRSYCSIYKNNKQKNVYLGDFINKEQAFQCYKRFKENYIKEVAEEYKNLIPTKLYEAMYKYEVEITD